MDGVEHAVAPVVDEVSSLVLGGKLGAVAERDAGGRAGADVDDRREAVDVIGGPFAGAAAPAELAAAGQRGSTRVGRVPRRAHVPFHVGIVGEQLAVRLNAMSYWLR